MTSFVHHYEPELHPSDILNKTYMNLEKKANSVSHIRRPIMFRPSYLEDIGLKICLVVIIIALVVFAWFCCAHASEYTDNQIADAIYHAEGGAKTSHPYGILAHYKHTTPRQACLNTIAHARRDFKGGDFIVFLGNRYCPVGAKNDPTGLNRFWIRNVKFYLVKSK